MRDAPKRVRKEVLARGRQREMIVAAGNRDSFRLFLVRTFPEMYSSSEVGMYTDAYITYIGHYLPLRGRQEETINSARAAK